MRADSERRLPTCQRVEPAHEHPREGANEAEGPFSPAAEQAAQKGPDARRRPKAAREAYSLYVERADEGANEADGPFSAACLGLGL
jgi:hypothetical protein